MQATLAPVETPEDGQPPIPKPEPPSPPRRSSSTPTVAVILIALGALFLAVNLFGAPVEAIFLALGVAFAFARAATGRHGLAVPAGILLGFGAYVLFTTYWRVPDTRGAWFFLFLGLGFLASYVIGARYSVVWPLVPAAALIGFGAMLLAWVDLLSFAQLPWMGQYWPLLLIVFGLWIIVSTRLPFAWRRLAAAIAMILLVALGLLVLAASMAGTLGPATGSILGTSGPGPFFVQTELRAPMAAADTLHVINRSGNVTIRAGAPSVAQVRAQVTKRYWSPDVAPAVQLTRAGDVVTLETVPPAGGLLGPTSSVELVVDLPGQSPVDVEVGSGAVQLTGQTGPAQVVTGSGDIQLRDAVAPATIRTGSGNISLSSARGQIQAWTGSGTITGTGLQLGGSLESGSGAIRLDGQFASDLVVHAGSGAISVQFDPASSVRVDAATGSGVIRVPSLPMANQQLASRTLTGTLGAAAGTLHIQTGSGDITLR
jgi:hypothetical protein